MSGDYTIHTHTPSYSTAEKKKRQPLIQRGREISQPPWKPERQSGGKALVEDWFFKHTGSSGD